MSNTNTILAVLKKTKQKKNASSKLDVGCLPLLSHRLDHHPGGLEGIRRVGFPRVPVEARRPTDVVARGVPVAVQTGRAASTVPPAAAAFSKAAVVFSDVTEDARGAVVVVLVHGAEAEAVLVDALVSSTDGVTCGHRWKPFRKT